MVLSKHGLCAICVAERPPAKPGPAKGMTVAEDNVLEGKVFEVPESFRRDAHISSVEQYQEMYERSLENPDEFWAEAAERLTWFKKWDQVQNHDFANAKIRWYDCLLYTSDAADE